jgi:hypothetical protein
MVSEPLVSEPARDVDHSVPPRGMESSTTGWLQEQASQARKAGAHTFSIWAPERNRRRTPLHALRRRLTRRFESLSHTEKDQPEMHNINLLATTARLWTVPQPCNLGPIGYREFESSASANIAPADSLSVC